MPNSQHPKKSVDVGLEESRVRDIAAHGTEKLGYERMANGMSVSRGATLSS
jgi:hypothetical protein